MEMHAIQSKQASMSSGCIGYPEVQIATWGSVPTSPSLLVFTDEAALRQCRSGWMTRYRKLSGSELS